MMRRCRKHPLLHLIPSPSGFFVAGHFSAILEPEGDSERRLHLSASVGSSLPWVGNCCDYRLPSRANLRPFAPQGTCGWQRRLTRRFFRLFRQELAKLALVCRRPRHGRGFCSLKESSYQLNETENAGHSDALIYKTEFTRRRIDRRQQGAFHVRE